MQENKYLSAASKVEGGGMLVLQEAELLKKTSKGGGKATYEVQVIFAIVFAGSSDVERALSVELGEWFQNRLVPLIKDKGTDSLINVCIDGLGGRQLADRLASLDYSCFIVAGDEAVLSKSGSSTAVYSIEKLFDKELIIPMEPGNAGIMVQLEGGAALVISDRSLVNDEFYSKQIAASIGTVREAAQMEKIITEITSIEAIEAGSVVAVKAVK